MKSVRLHEIAPVVLDKMAHGGVFFTVKDGKGRVNTMNIGWGSIANYWNQPVGLGGTRKDGTSEFNHVSKIILEVMDECNLTTPKFLVKVAPNTPDWAMDKMMDMARRHRSLSFTGEVPLANALKKWQGASDDDCRKAVMTGCYEFQLHDGANQTGVGHVNFLKPIEKMLEEVRVESLKLKVES